MRVSGSIWWEMVIGGDRGQIGSTETLIPVVERGKEVVSEGGVGRKGGQM